MSKRWAALCVVLAVSAFGPRQALGQSSQQTNRDSRAGSLGQNYPNPFNPETTIPFGIGGSPECPEAGRQYRVSLRIYNLVMQLVAVPVLQGGSTAGQPVVNVLLTCNQYTAYWDGKDMRSGREVASGVYLYRLEVDGRASVKKMIVMK
jgi:hypothetical protein